RTPHRETFPNLLYQLLQAARTNGRLYFHSAKSGEHPSFIKAGSFAPPGPVLRDAHPSLEPRRSRILVGTIPWRTRAERCRLKQPVENFRRAPDSIPLRIQCQKSSRGLHLRVPILVSDPRHPPVNVRSLCLP